MDILQIAQNKGFWTVDQCNAFIQDAITINQARFPVSRIEDYQSRIELNQF